MPIQACRFLLTKLNLVVGGSTAKVRKKLYQVRTHYRTPRVVSNQGAKKKRYIWMQAECTNVHTVVKMRKNPNFLQWSWNLYKKKCLPLYADEYHFNRENYQTVDGSIIIFEEPLLQAIFKSDGPSIGDCTPIGWWENKNSTHLCIFCSFDNASNMATEKIKFSWPINDYGTTANRK